MGESPPLPFPHRTSPHPPFPHPSFPRPFDLQPPFPQPLFPRRSRDNSSSHRDLSTTTLSDGSSRIRLGVWSGVVVALVFYFFASVILIFGVYAPEDTRLGPYSSILINPNHFFVESIKVEELEPVKDLMLYGFHKNPPLDDVIKWTDSHKVTFPASTHKEWMFYLNEGSRINISYSVNSHRSSLVLVIVEGIEGLDAWLDNPSYPNTALSLNIIHGNGTFQYEMPKSSSYYIAVGNLNYEVVEMELKIGIKALLYNTTEAYHQCNIAEGQCNVNLFFLSKNAALLASPGQISGLANGYWSVKILYGPRWSVYLVGIVVVTMFVLLINHILNSFRSTNQEDGIGPAGLVGSERTSLLVQKDDNHSSQGSSYASDSDDEEYLEHVQAGDTHNGKPVRDDEYNSNVRRLCAICFDDPRDCFFIPCGHCVACFGCATRIVASSGNCPICRRHTKKVRKIYSV
ncbi:E3 ubiquitin-protein ligase APD2-like isoform X2 [Primulina huaijiensis]|uniref:E3 ubiquitin-protein ligase APD2-like isoform X2 n=1 Tax=Primulina huaijiensis TaxID=1492673 RepID=UPI003CC71355